jgi:hypothetical protein
MKFNRDGAFFLPFLLGLRVRMTSLGWRHRNPNYFHFAAVDLERNVIA